MHEPANTNQLDEKALSLHERVAGWLKPGGKLVYAVCSLQPEEGVQRIAAFHAPSDDTDIAAELARLLDRLRLQAVEEELKAMFESGTAASPDAQARGRELLTIQARLKTQLAGPISP